jgi:hypothetical protein
MVLYLMPCINSHNLKQAYKRGDILWAQGDSNHKFKSESNLKLAAFEIGFVIILSIDLEKTKEKHILI